MAAGSCHRHMAKEARVGSQVGVMQVYEWKGWLPAGGPPCTGQRQETGPDPYPQEAVGALAAGTHSSGSMGSPQVHGSGGQ